MRELRQEVTLADIEKNLQKIIPDGWIGRFILDAPFLPPNRLDDCETFVGFEPMASLSMTSNVRTQQVLADTEKRAHNVDLKFPGSTFKFSSPMIKLTDTSFWSSALMWIFLTIYGLAFTYFLV